MKKIKLQESDNKKFFAGSAFTALALVGLLGAGLVSAATFANNTLVRGMDGQVFVIKQGEKVKVNGLDELRRDFRGKQIINVDDDVLKAIKTKINNSGPGNMNAINNSGPGNAKNNALLRSDDHKIFEIVQGERRQVKDLNELHAKFRNRQILNVDAEALKRFPISLKDKPDQLFVDNRLIRNQNRQVFVVEDNGLRRIADLNELRREHLGQAIHNVSTNILLANGVKLRGDGTIDDNSHGVRGLDDFLNGVKLRGDGSIDDNSTGASGSDDFVNGVKLRGDGTVDDNSTVSGKDRSTSGGSSSGGSTDD